MKIDKQVNKEQGRLLLFFSGWSASPELFRPLKAEPGTDVWVCYDYRDLRFGEDLSAYKEIRLVAWSLGVWVASALFRGNKDMFVETIAINGTDYPVHDTWGIPPAVFEGTLANVTEEGMHRFNRRMCGGREVLQTYEKVPSRPIDEVREELQTLYTHIKEDAVKPVADNFWTRAVIASGDRIFPFANLHNYWQNRCQVTVLEAPHYPFYLWKQWNEIWKQ